MEVTLKDILKKKFKQGDKLYSILYGEVILFSVTDSYITFYKESDPSKFYETNRMGVMTGANSSSCMSLFPSENERDWMKVAFGLEYNSPVVVSDNGINWILAKYIGYDLESLDLIKLNIGAQIVYFPTYKYIVLLNDFDFNNPNDNAKNSLL